MSQKQNRIEYINLYKFFSHFSVLNPPTKLCPHIPMRPVQYIKLFYHVRNSKELCNVRNNFVLNVESRRITFDSVDILLERRYWTDAPFKGPLVGETKVEPQRNYTKGLRVEGNDRLGEVRNSRDPARTMRKTIKQTFEGVGVTTRRGKFYTQGRRTTSLVFI